MTRAAALVAVIALFALSPAPAQDKPVAGDRVTITETVFVPPIYYVGDPVEMRLTILPQSGVQLTKTTLYPTASWVKIKNVEVRKEPPYEKVTIHFVSFAPGTKTLPPLVLGDVTLSDLRILTSSLLEKDTTGELAPLRDQLVLPQTELFFFLIFVVFICLPIAVFALWKPVRQRWFKLARHYDRHRPFKKLNRDVKALSLKGLALSGPEFYTQYSLILRTYLTGRMGRDFTTLTSRELPGALEQLPVAWVNEWIRLLKKADQVRFDSQDAPASERMEDLDNLKRAAALVQNRELNHVDV